MKIIFLVPAVPPAINGIGEYTFHLTRALREIGEDAHIFTSAGQSSSAPWIHPVISSWNQQEILHRLKSISPDWVCLQYVPQLYHPQGVCWNISGLMQTLKKELKCKTAVTFHEFTCGWKASLKAFVLSVLFTQQTVRLLRNLDLAVTTCEIYHQILQKHAPGVNVQTIPVGANILPVTHHEQDISCFKKKLGIGSQKIFSVFGRFSSFRNYSIGLEILKEANRRQIPASLLLIGCVRSSNPEIFGDFIEKAAEDGLRGQIIETGDLSAEDISLCLALTDIFLFPQADGISTRNTTAMSAMAHGLPIITYQPRPGDFEGYEIPWGIAVERGDADSFVKAALHLTDPPTDNLGRQKTIDYFSAHFSWEIITNRYLKSFRTS